MIEFDSKDDLYKYVCTRLQKIREHNFDSDKSLADAVGVSTSSINRIKNSNTPEAFTPNLSFKLLSFLTDSKREAAISLKKIFPTWYQTEGVNMNDDSKSVRIKSIHSFTPFHYDVLSLSAIERGISKDIILKDYGLIAGQKIIDDLLEEELVKDSGEYLCCSDTYQGFSDTNDQIEMVRLHLESTSSEALINDGGIFFRYDCVSKDQKTRIKKEVIASVSRINNIILEDAPRKDEVLRYSGLFDFKKGK